MHEQNRLALFEQTVLPHLDAAHNLARWLTHSNQDAEDVVQEAYLRAFKFFDSFRGGDSRAWLLMIVRNTCYSWLRKNRMPEASTSFDEETNAVACYSTSPEDLFQLHADREVLQHALEELPVEFREVIILRELERLSYKEIAYVTHVPVGTVMSRLARARRRLAEYLASERDGGEDQ